MTLVKIYWRGKINQLSRATTEVSHLLSIFSLSSPLRTSLITLRGSKTSGSQGTFLLVFTCIFTFTPFPLSFLFLLLSSLSLLLLFPFSHSLHALSFSFSPTFFSLLNGGTACCCLLPYFLIFFSSFHFLFLQRKAVINSICMLCTAYILCATRIVRPVHSNVSRTSKPDRL